MLIGVWQLCNSLRTTLRKVVNCYNYPYIIDKEDHDVWRGRRRLRLNYLLPIRFRIKLKSQQCAITASGDGFAKSFMSNTTVPGGTLYGSPG